VDHRGCDFDSFDVFIKHVMGEERKLLFSKHLSEKHTITRTPPTPQGHPGRIATHCHMDAHVGFDTAPTKRRQHHDGPSGSSKRRPGQASRPPASDVMSYLTDPHTGQQLPLSTLRKFKTEGRCVWCHDLGHAGGWDGANCPKKRDNPDFRKFPNLNPKTFLK